MLSEIYPRFHTRFSSLPRGRCQRFLPEVSPPRFLPRGEVRGVNRQAHGAGQGSPAGRWRCLPQGGATRPATTLRISSKQPGDLAGR